MPFRLRRVLALLPVVTLLLAGLLWPLPTASSPLPLPPRQGPTGGGRLFSETGFRLGAAGDPFAEYFAARGGVATFGYPTSRSFLLLGTRVQFFQRHVMQQLPSGVGLLNILDEGYLPYTDFSTVSIPPVASSFAASAPAPGTPEYGRAVVAFVSDTVPNVWMGQPVGFLDAFLQPGWLAGEADPVRQALVGLEIYGFPISPVAPDPLNSQFVYQRFQRAVLQYDPSTGLAQPLLMADYLKAVMTGQNVPQGLAAQAQGSRFFQQYRPGAPAWIARGAELPDTDLTLAFEREDGAATGPGLVPTPPLALPTSAPFAPGQPLPPVAFPPTPVFNGSVPPLASVATSVSQQPTPSPTPTRIQERPVIEGTEPGGAQVGQDIVIRGRFFGAEPGQVLFTGKLAIAQVWSEYNIVVTVPQGAVDGNVRVRRPDGIISNGVGFSPYSTPTVTPTETTPTPTFTPTPSATPVRPSVTGLEPYAGPPDSAVLIRGAGFGSTTGNVLFGNFAAPVNLWSDTSILVTVPFQLDTRTVRVLVVRADGAVTESPTPLCFIGSLGTPTPTPFGAPTATAGPTPAATTTPTRPTGC